MPRHVQQGPSRIGGRANLGNVVEDGTNTFKILLVLEASIHETMIDPEIIARPIHCKLSRLDYDSVHKVCMFVYIYICI